MARPKVFVLDRKARVADEVGLALAGRFDVEHARNLRVAERMLQEGRPLVMTVAVDFYGAVAQLREASGRGCLFVGYGEIPVGNRLRGTPKGELLTKLALDDVVTRNLTGEDVGKLVWSHVAAAIRSVPRPPDQPTEREEETWTRILTSEASVDSFRRLLTKDLSDVHEVGEEDDPTWGELLKSRVSGTSIKKILTKKIV